jgi:hypothetical protein
LEDASLNDDDVADRLDSNRRVSQLFRSPTRSMHDSSKWITKPDEVLVVGAPVV